jgi:septum formation protein
MSIRRVVLASRSSRRRQLLEEAGFDVDTQIPAIDDSDAVINERVPERLVISLAWFKASQIACELDEVLALVAADTVCDLDGKALGKPADQQAAERMLRSMFGREHLTRTGVCVCTAEGRMLFEDSTLLRMGTPSDEDIEAYLASGSWEGKAGGYNLSERIEAGWPIEFEGDPTTVMGLPMQRLVPLLEELAVRRE